MLHAVWRLKVQNKYPVKIHAARYTFLKKVDEGRSWKADDYSNKVTLMNPLPKTQIEASIYSYQLLMSLPPSRWWSWNLWLANIKRLGYLPSWYTNDCHQCINKPITTCTKPPKGCSPSQYIPSILIPISHRWNKNITPPSNPYDIPVKPYQTINHSNGKSPIYNNLYMFLHVFTISYFPKKSRIFGLIIAGCLPPWLESTKPPQAPVTSARLAYSSAMASTYVLRNGQAVVVGQ